MYLKNKYQWRPLAVSLVVLLANQALHAEEKVDDKESQKINSSDIVNLSGVIVQVKENELAGYDQAVSSKKLGKDELNRYRGTGNGDVFQGIPGVQVNNIRNEGGGLDIGIRGIQGEGRVPVVIDGSLQSTHAFRGYQGNSDRTYIDMDLISSVIIDKGTSGNKQGVGAIGGLVQMKTLGVQDILNGDKNYGFLVKGSLYNNNKSVKVGDDEKSQNDYLLTDKIKGRDFRNGAFTLGFAYQNDLFDFMTAYSHRKVGNYFAGKHGRDRAGVDRWDISAGQEVTNTSYQSDSGIAKFGFNISDEQRVEVNLRRHVQKAGEVMAFYFSKYITEHGDNMPQWKPGTADIRTGNIEYKYKPINNSLIDFNVSIWKTSAKMHQFNAISAAGMYGDQYLGSYSDNRQGINLDNTSRLEAIPLTLQYGLTYDEQRMKPREVEKYKKSARDAKRDESSLFLNMNYATKFVDFNTTSRFHKSSITDYNGYSRYVYYGVDQRAYKTQLDWSVGVDIHVNDYMDVYARYSNSYRNPSLFEGTVSSQTFSHHWQYPVKPEHSKVYELGIKGNYQDILNKEDSLNFGITYFHNNIKNFITTGERPNTGEDAPYWAYKSYTFVNYDQFLLKGYEVSLSYDHPSFFIMTNATFYKNPEICPNKNNACNVAEMAWSFAPTRIPPKKEFNLTAGKYFLDKALTIGGNIRYHSLKKSPKGWMLGTGISGRAVEYIPASTTVDLFAKYSIDKNTELTFNIDNLTNRYSLDPGAVIAMPKPGRTVRLGLEVKF